MHALDTPHSSPEPTPSGASSASPLSALVRRALDIDTRFGHLVQYAGAAVTPTKPTLLTLSDDRGWLVLAAGNDPQVIRGTLAMPLSVQQHLRKVEQAAIGFDMVYIAHELPSEAIKGVSPSDLDKPEVLKTLVGRPSENATAKKIVGIANRTIDAITKTTLAAGNAAALIGGAAIGALGSLALDPALFGVVTATGAALPGELGAWFLLAHWT